MVTWSCLPSPILQVDALLPVPAYTPDNWRAIKASLLPVIYAGGDSEILDAAVENLDAILATFCAAFADAGGKVAGSPCGA